MPKNQNRPQNVHSTRTDPIISESNGHRLELDQKGHKYRLDGLIVPGVTSIIKAGYPTSEALIVWRIKQGIEEHLSGEKLKRAANIGTIVHDLIEKAEGNKPYEIPEIEEVKNCWKAYQSFKESKPVDEEILAAEEVIACPSKGYAGKFDCLAKWQGKTILRDYKTAGGIYASAWFQCALYTRALQEWKGIEVDLWQIARFGKTGVFDWDRDVITMSDPKAMKDYTEQAMRCVDTYYFIQRYDGKSR